MRRRSSKIRKKKSIVNEKTRLINKEERDAARELGFLFDKTSTENLNEETLLKYVLDNMDTAEIDDKEKLSHYNNCSVHFLSKGEIVECALEVIPEGTSHSFYKDIHLIIVLITLCMPVGPVYIHADQYLKYGSAFIVPFLIIMIFIGFPSFATTLFVGVRFRGHLHKFYMGFIGFVILQYIQMGLECTDMIYQTSLLFERTTQNMFIYYPAYEKCIVSPNDDFNMTYTMGKLF